MIIEALILGGCTSLFHEVNKSMKIDAQAIQKNSRAFTHAAEAEHKILVAQERLVEKLKINAIRKNAILNGHIKMFQEQCSVIRKIETKSGKGIFQMEQINSINDQLTQYLTHPAISSGNMMSNSQMFITYALKGIGGLMISESKQNLDVAKRNMSKANAVCAQAETICIAYDAMATHTDLITDLLQKLGALYIKSIKNVVDIINRNGTIGENYSTDDIDAINTCFLFTKTIYRIINTPMVNNEGVIEQESLCAISEGQDLIDSISKGE